MFFYLWRKNVIFNLQSIHKIQMENMMDIGYLIFLQNFRESTSNVLTPFMEFISGFGIGFVPIAFICMIYWIVDKKVGQWIFLNLGCSTFINGSILKITACVYRPWIKDPRVIPAGDSIVTATGYSFPSGHSTLVTSYFGVPGLWLWKKKSLLSILLFSVVFLVLFSRNYLGVHYPQDVVIGFAVPILMSFISKKLLNWIVSEKNRDLYFLLSIILVTILGLIYINYKPYPIHYVDGKLLVDPKKMIADAYESFGTLLGFSIGIIVERRFIKFEIQKGNKKQTIISLLSLIPLYFWVKQSVAWFEPIIGRCNAKFLSFFVIAIYPIMLVPIFLKLVQMKKEKS